MADYTNVSPNEEAGHNFNRKLAGLHVCLPGVIAEFDASAQRAKVRPATKIKVVTNGAVSYRDYPLLINVPVVLPYAQGAGLLLTLPITPGDECLLVFADRNISNFSEMGGVQIPELGDAGPSAMLRHHHLSDAICIPGVISRPNVVDAHSTTNIELRDKSRTQYLSLGPDGITITDGTAKWNMSGGKVTLDAPAGIAETSQADISQVTTATQTLIGGNISIGNPSSPGVSEIEDSLKSRNGTFIDQNNVVLGSHVHTGVEAGGGNTGGPV